MKRYIISLLSIILVLALIAPAMASSVSITIWGTNGNASGAQKNATITGNNTVSVSAWNVTKTVLVKSLNASGDTVSLNISNMTAWRVYELKVNGTAINGYQATENGMVNFTYSQNSSNVTYSLSPAVNQNGVNFTWSRHKAITIDSFTPTLTNQTVIEDTVYPANGTIILFGWSTNNVAYSGCVRFGKTNPPTQNVICGAASSTDLQGQTIAFMNRTDYFILESVATLGNIRMKAIL